MPRTRKQVRPLPRRVRLARAHDDFWCHEPHYARLADRLAEQIVEFLYDDLDWSADQIRIFTRSELCDAIVAAAIARSNSEPTDEGRNK